MTNDVALSLAGVACPDEDAVGARRRAVASEVDEANWDYRISGPLAQYEDPEFSHADIYGEDADNAALQVAAVYNNVDVMDSLLTRGADLDGTDQYNETPLYNAAMEGHIAAVDLLLTRGANPNIANEDGVTPLFEAAKGGYTGVVRLLLQNNADPNKATLDTDATLDRLTPLHVAAEHNHVEAVQLLLEHGADHTIQNNDGKTARDLALERGHADVVSLLSVLPAA